jgi:hypothetical protein
VAIGLVGRRECTASVAWFRDGCFLKGGEKNRLVKKEWTAKCTVKRMELAPAQNSKERGLRDGKRDGKEGKE